MSAILPQPKYSMLTSNDLLLRMLKSIPVYVPGWKSNIGTDVDELLRMSEDPRDLGMVMMKIIAHYAEIIITELNRVPEKNFLTFLDFMGIEPYPPRPSKVPLTFYLAEGAKGSIRIQQGTGIGSSLDESIIFETDDEIILTPVRVERAVSIYPAHDKWTNHSVNKDGTMDEYVRLFHGDKLEARIEHILWIGINALKSQTETSSLFLYFEFDEDIEGYHDFISSLRWEISDQWNIHNPTITITEKKMMLEFSGRFDMAEMEVNSVDHTGKVNVYSSYWLRVRSTQKLPVNMPKVESLKYEIKAENDSVSMDMAFYNTTSLDISKDFYPFGEKPRFNDTFYIASEFVFTNPDNKIKISIDLTPDLEPETSSVTLLWEYFAGGNWRELGISSAEDKKYSNQYGFIDTTKGLTKSGYIEFLCPIMDLIKINGKEALWIRCRLMSGGYGHEAQFKLRDGAEPIEGSTDYALSDYIYSPESYIPPSISRLLLSHESSLHKPDRCLISTSGIFRDVSALSSFELVTYANETLPCVYLGLEGIEGLTVESLTLFLDIAPRLYGERLHLVHGVNETQERLVSWEYWNGSAWQSLSAYDKTNNLTRPEVITFQIPTDLQRRYLYKQKLYWIRAVLSKGTIDAPKLSGIYVNTAWASQKSSLQNEILGSSNGEPLQVFSFSKKPVLYNEVIEINEPVIPKDYPYVNVVRDASNNIKEIWVKWTSVNNFGASGPSDRHYMIDYANGQVIFGDGIYGFIPPVGKSNIRASAYNTGGGKAGNCIAGILTVLKTTIPGVDGVTNHMRADGGLDQEDIRHVMERGPHTIKNRNRAVTIEDYEWITKQFSPSVARVHALSNKKIGVLGELVDSNGWITIVVIPDSISIKPMPDAVLLNDIRAWLQDRSLVNLSNRLDVIGPSYSDINVDVVVVSEGAVDEKTIKLNIIKAIDEFFHPLTGGRLGSGWEFGRAIKLSEIISVIRDADGVNRLREITVYVDGISINQYAMPVNFMPFPSSHSIVIERMVK